MVKYHLTNEKVKSFQTNVYNIHLHLHEKLVNLYRT